jgi:hypothetical protein
MRLGKGGLRRLKREEAGQGRQAGKREREGRKGWKTAGCPMGGLSCMQTQHIISQLRKFPFKMRFPWKNFPSGDFSEIFLYEIN